MCIQLDNALQFHEITVNYNSAEAVCNRDQQVVYTKNLSKVNKNSR